jgi:hypothetical protein
LKFGSFRKLITEAIRSYLLLDRELINALWEATASALRRRRLRKSCLSEIQCFESRVVLSGDSLGDAFIDSVVDNNATMLRATDSGNSEPGLKPTEADEWLSAVDANMASWDGNTALLGGERVVSAAGLLAASESDVSAMDGSDFSQWYSNNSDTILAVWSNVISGLDLNDSTVDQTAALSQLWNETLRSLYGAELPWDDDTVVESDAVVTEDTVRVDETASDSVVNVVTTLLTNPVSLANPVDLSYTSLRPLLYVYNETPADGSYGGVASELIEISSVVSDETGELISRRVLEDRLTGNQYLLPAEITLVSERDLTVMLQYYGISEYRVEDQDRWVIPVSPDEGIGFLNRAWSLTYYDEIRSYLRSAGETQTEVFSSTDFTVEAVLAAADPSTGRDLTLSLPDTRIGIHYETVTISSDGSVYGAPLRDPNQSLTDSVNLHTSDRNSHSGESLLAHGEDNLEHHDQAGDKHRLAEMDTRAGDLSFPRPQVVSGSLKNDAAGAIADSLDAYLTNVFPDTVVTRSGNVVGSPSLRQVEGLTASAFGYVESPGSRAAFAEIEGVPSLSLMNEYRRANSSFPRIVNAGLHVLSERTSQLWSLLSEEAEQSRLFLTSSDRIDFNAAPATSIISSASQVSSLSGMLKEERTGINGASNTTLTSARRQEFDQEANSHAGSSASARYERFFRLLHRYWKALKARYSGARMTANVEPADEVIIPEMKMQSELSAQIACQRVRYFIVARGPPADDLPPEYEWIVLCDGSDQLNRLRHVMSPRGPSPDSAQQQVQVSSPFRGLISAESIC